MKKNKIFLLIMFVGLFLIFSCSYSNAYNSVSIPTNNSFKPKSLGFYNKEEIIKTEYKKHVFCGYATDIWKKASSYNSNQTYSASIGYNFYGVNTTIGFSKSESAQIPANSKRYSKLALFADITFKKVKISRYQGGHPKPYSITYRVDKVYHEKYLDVVYK